MYILCIYVLVILTPKCSCDFVSLPSNDPNNAASAAESWLKKDHGVVRCAIAGGGGGFTAMEGKDLRSSLHSLRDHQERGERCER